MIGSVSYKATDLSSDIKNLTAKHDDRIKGNEFFKDVERAEAKFWDEYNKNSISLNLEKRRAQKKADDAESLAVINRNLKETGKPEISNLKDLPNKYEPFDAYLDESARIALDLADLQKK